MGSPPVRSARWLVADHTKTLQAFRDEAAYGFDPDVRDFAARQLPTLQMHWEEAMALQMAVRGGRGMGRPMGEQPMPKGHGHH